MCIGQKTKFVSVEILTFSLRWNGIIKNVIRYLNYGGSLLKFSHLFALNFKSHDKKVLT